MFDIIIISAEKDFNKLKYVYQSIVNNVVDKWENIYLISEQHYYINDDVIRYTDNFVLPIDIKAIPYRPKWIYQQYIKLFQDITKCDLYLTVDADVMFNKKISLFEDNKPTFFLGRDQNHHPYFNFSQEMLNQGRAYHRSFINEFMLFDKKIVNEILSNFGYDKFEFIRRANKRITKDCYLSEFELYGNYVYLNHRDSYNYKSINTSLGGKRRQWREEEIERRIKHMSTSNYDVFTIHTW